MSTQAEIKALVTEHWKRTDKDIDAAISGAYREILSIIPHHKNEDRVYRDLVEGIAFYPLPNSFLRINHPIRLIDSDGSSDSTGSFPLRFMSKDEYDFWTPYPDSPNPSKGIPWGYALWKNSIYVTSIPDKTYIAEINLGGEINDLLVEADESILSVTFDETVAAGALKRLFGGVKLYDDMGYWANVYINGHAGDQGAIVGGIKLLKQIEEDNFKPMGVVKNNPL